MWYAGNVTAKVCSVREIANVVRHNAFGSGECCNVCFCLCQHFALFSILCIGLYVVPGTRPTGADAQAAADILIPDKNQDTR